MSWHACPGEHQIPMQRNCRFESGTNTTWLTAVPDVCVKRVPLNPKLILHLYLLCCWWVPPLRLAAVSTFRCRLRPLHRPNTGQAP